MDDDPDVPSLLDLIDEEEKDSLNESFVPQHTTFTPISPPPSNNFSSTLVPISQPTFSQLPFQQQQQQQQQSQGISGLPRFEDIPGLNLKKGGIGASFDAILSNPAIQNLYQNNRTPSKQEVEDQMKDMNPQQLDQILSNFNKIVKSGYLPSSLIPKGVKEALEQYEEIKSMEETSVNSIIDDSMILDGDQINILELNEEEDPILKRNNSLFLFIYVYF